MARLEGRAFSHYGRTNGMAGDHVRVICERKDGSVWIGTTTGLTRYENEQWRNYTKEQGLLSDTVTSLYEDVDRNLWIATGEGLNLKNAVESTQRRKGAKTQGFWLLGPITRWVSHVNLFF